ncbi:MAG: hypothetical protein ACI8YP_001326 [Algoriphagus sp.]|jgi:hypothetical protein
MPLQKKVVRLTLLLTFGISMLFVSCIEEPVDSLIDAPQSEIISENLTQQEFELNLVKLSLLFGEVFKDPIAQEELFSFSRLDQNSGSIEINLKSLFEQEMNPGSRKKSEIVNAFQKYKDPNARIDSDLKIDELISFIIDNAISILAPYLGEDFSGSELKELTVSWWTEEFEEEHMAKDEDWAGQTKGIRIPFTNGRADFKTASEVLSDGFFLVGDDWAQSNPTIVLGSFPVKETNSKAKMDSNSSRISGAPVALCDATNKSTQSIVVRMPAFRLEDNIAPWPKDNYIYLWVGFAGGVTFGPNGLPTLTPNINLVMSGQSGKITRKEARIQRWKTVQSAFIISNWNPEADNMYLVWGYEKRNSTIDYTGALKATKDGVSAENSFKIAERDEIRLISALSFDKCFTIRNNVSGIDQGWGFYSGTTLPRYPFGEIRAYFTLETL